MQFLDVRTDYAFKKVFGSIESKETLISFLNALIYFDRKHKIKDLTIVDPYNIPMIKGMKDTYVDVKAILDDDTKVIIEMQVLNHKGFEKRVLYNAAKNYSIQLDKGDDYHLLNPVIALSIVDFIMFEDHQKIISNYKLVEKEEFISYNDDIELIFVELPKFKKELDELQDIKEQWIYFVKNAGSLEYIPNNIDNEIKKALNYVNEASMTKEELEAQHKRKEFISIQRLAIMKADEDGINKGIVIGMEKGKEEGREEGREEGEKLAKIEIAQKSIIQGLDDATIYLITGLATETIKLLRDKI
ncbi:MAG: Rpn family recombination-promoting nuclease/putative transposase [Sulfurimonas sp.]|jgi:predicted transposase/invertase (TIGR01784 family)